VALSIEHRTTIYERLSPILGEEEAQALVAQFPARAQDEPVTKHDLALLRSDLALLRSDLRTEMRDLQATNTRWLVTTMLAISAIQTAAIPILVNVTG
jgi:hypothetical protein